MAKYVYEQESDKNLVLTRTGDFPLTLSFDGLLIALLAIFAFSPFGWGMALKIGGNFFPEPALVVFILYGALSKGILGRIFRSTVRSDTFLYSISFLVAAFVIGFLFHRDISASYSDFRPCLILAFFFSLFSVRSLEMKAEAAKIAFSFNFWVIIFNLLGSYFISSGQSVKVVYPILSSTYCGIFLLRVGIFKFNDSFLYLILLLGAAMAILSFYRAFYVCAILLLLPVFAHFISSLLFPSRRLESKISSLIVLLVIVASLTQASALSNSIYSYLSSSESRYIQSVGKLNDIISLFDGGGGGSGDLARKLYYERIWQNADAFMLPSGLGQKTTEGNWRSQWSDAGYDGPSLQGKDFSSKDGGFIYMATQFGLIFTIMSFVILMVTLFKSGMRSKYHSSVYMKKKHFSRAILGLTLLSIYGVTGAMFVQVAFALTFGSCLGLLIYWNEIGRSYQDVSILE